MEKSYLVGGYQRRRNRPPLIFDRLICLLYSLPRIPEADEPIGVSLPSVEKLSLQPLFPSLFELAVSKLLLVWLRGCRQRDFSR